MNKAALKAVAVAVTAIVYTVSGSIAESQTAKKATTTPDIKIRQRITSGGKETGAETIMYVKGARMRSEMIGNALGMTTIVQCDLKRTLTINEKTRTYLVTPMEGTDVPIAPAAVAATGPGSSAAQPQQETRGGIVNVTNTTTDTGERKDMFGFTARHIKTSIVKKASPEACDKDHQSETDGWYIDFQYAFDCPAMRQRYRTPSTEPQSVCRDEVRTKTVGSAKLGFPVLVTTTAYQPDGSTTTATQEVLELSREPLNASLFEVPEGYALAKDMQELYGMSRSANQSNPRTTSTSVSSDPSSAGNPGSMPGTGTAKKAGAVRIGVVMPKAQLSAGNPADAADEVRKGFANYLNGPTIEVVTLTARLPSLALEEARQNQCDYILYSSLTQKKGGGGGMFGRTLGNVAGSAVGHIPGGSTAGTAAARSATIAGVYTAAGIAGSIKARDEVSLEYKLEATDTAHQGVANTLKAKASRDGEDILTPLIERAAEAVVTAVPKAKS